MRLEFGYKYQEMITEFKGILTQRTKHITGCDRVELTNNEGEQKWFPLSMLEYLENGIYDKLGKESFNKFSDIDEAGFKLGDKAKDKVTGFEGTIIAISCPLVGDIGYCLSPIFNSNSKENDGNWFDEGRIELIKEENVKVDTNKKRVGGATCNLALR